jgi:hypothetical protein
VFLSRHSSNIQRCHALLTHSTQYLSYQYITS